ncbi:hypothetical protein [Streptomyces ficellus]|uniref:hypothetical protein n=1 Tax=Streptomyces ficellus TaxID=1977088 RepID=UPI001FCBFE80|nr:hypothetical protein [Streptomyces ficellus]
MTAVLPGRAWAVAPGAAGATDSSGGPGAYAFAEGITPIRGAAGTSDAPRLTAGETYKDALKSGSELVYRLDLDAKSNAYVSAVAVPKPGSKVATSDRLKVSVQDRNGIDCGSNDARFGSADFPRPLAAFAYRTMKRDGSTCQEAGPYYAVIERESDAGSTADAWDLEIRHELEPGLKTEGPTAAPENWPSASPPAPAGGSRERTGGASFSDATGLTTGEWTDHIEPGQSRFYRVPVDWGQQLFASADLGSSPGSGSVGGALAVTMFNPMQGVVNSADSVLYDGDQKSVDLDPMPPVKYENRYDYRAQFSNARFAGWYYLRVSLNPKVAEEFGKKPYGLTLRVTVRGDAAPAPAYDGPAGIFDVSAADEEAAANGQSGPEAERSGTMKLVAATGIGAGSVLLLGLGAWALLARRRAARTARPDAGSAGPPQFGPPTSW